MEEAQGHPVDFQAEEVQAVQEEHQQQVLHIRVEKETNGEDNNRVFRYWDLAFSFRKKFPDLFFYIFILVYHISIYDMA